MQRILEPEVMDSQEDAREYNKMDHAEVNRAFIAELSAFVDANGKRFRGEDDPDFDELVDPDVLAGWLDVGTGTALIPIELCKQRDEIRVMAIDMAISMLDLGIANVDIAGLREQIQLAQVDAKDTGFEDQMFDGLISNSIIHHIHQPELSVDEMTRVTRPEGVIFVRDLMRPESESDVDKIVDTYAADETEYCRKLFRDSLCAALSLDEMRAFVEAAGCDPQHVTATSDRHWTWATIR